MGNAIDSPEDSKPKNVSIDSSEDLKPKNVLLIQVQAPETGRKKYQIEWARIENFFEADLEPIFKKINVEHSHDCFFDIGGAIVYVDNLARARKLPKNKLVMHLVYNIFWDNNKPYLREQLSLMCVNNTLMGGVLIYFEENAKGEVLRQKFDKKIAKDSTKSRFHY